jgi:hypothetical protein
MLHDIACERHTHSNRHSPRLLTMNHWGRFSHVALYNSEVIRIQWFPVETQQNLMNH